MNWCSRTRASLVAFALLVCGSLANAAELERRAPDAKAKAHEVFAWTAKNGLRYAWVVPPGYDGKAKRNLTVILHGSGRNYGWGFANNPPAVFRPADIVVSVDGTSPDGDARAFLDGPKDVAAFDEFLTEMRASFAVDRVYLYGHSQGGFFVVHFAGARPGEVAGVVAHASGAWMASQRPAALKQVAIAFMHGTEDPVVGYTNSLGSRDAYAGDGFELLQLRRLDRWTHWPNAVRATEMLDWCEGMTTTAPENALACALRMLTVKPADEYQWQTVPAFAGARDVLRRLAGDGPVPFKSVPAEVARTAKTWADAVESHAAQHVAKLEKALGKKGELTFGEKLPLGHLIPLREDFRGVDAVEACVKKLGLDKRATAQAKDMRALWDAWSSDKKPDEIARVVLETLPKCFLVDVFPLDFREKFDGWKSQGLKLGGKLTFANYDAWVTGWQQGRKDYAELWREWDGPEPQRKKH